MRCEKGSYGSALRLARGLALLAPEVLPHIAARVRANLRLAYGRADERLVRAVFRHFAEASVDLVFFRRLFDPGRFDEQFRFEGGALEHYRETKAEAAVFVTGHFGNWELYGTALAHLGFPIAPVARPIESAWFARWLDRFRSDHGQEVISKANALPMAMKALRDGACVAFLMDQAAGRHGIPVAFFGRPAMTYTAPAALALKFGVPLYAGYSTRLGDGLRYRCFAEHVEVDGGDIEAVTAKLNGILEGYVRARPEQWWWFHRRFKPMRTERAGKPLDAAGVPIP